MNIRTLVIAIVGLTYFGPVFAQQNDLDKLDKELAATFNTFTKSDYEARDSIGRFFKPTIKGILTDSNTFHYSFDSLSKQIRIIKSTDNRLKIYSWDEMSGGSWHDMAVFAQFETSNGQIKVKQLDPDEEAMTVEFTDVVIYEIHPIIIDNKTHYLTIGWGTHGSGHHHVTAQIFRIEGENLVKCDTCVENHEALVVEAPRVNEINFQFNPETNEITHNEFAYNGNIGFYQPTGGIVTWKLIDGVFKR